MTLDQALAFAILAATMILFIWGRLRYDLVGGEFACAAEKARADGEGLSVSRRPAVVRLGLLSRQKPVRSTPLAPVCPHHSASQPPCHKRRWTWGTAVDAYRTSRRFSIRPHALMLESGPYAQSGRLAIDRGSLSCRPSRTSIYWDCRPSPATRSALDVGGRGKPTARPTSAR